MLRLPHTVMLRFELLPGLRLTLQQRQGWHRCAANFHEHQRNNPPVLYGRTDTLFERFPQAEVKLHLDGCLSAPVAPGIVLTLSRA